MLTNRFKILTAKFTLMIWVVIVFCQPLAGAQDSYVVHYPLVSRIEGKTYIKDTGENKKKLTRLYRLRDKAFLYTDKNSKIRIELSKKSFLILEENSALEIPYIVNEKFKELKLVQGRFRFICEESDCALRVKSDLFDETVGAGDVIFEYQPEIPKMIGICLKGEFRFRGLEQEKTLLLQAKEYGLFIGQKLNNQVAYDVLLRGQKVAKGQASDALKLSDSDVQKYQQSKDLKTPPLYPIENKPKKRPGDICEKPFGQLNQCAWVCENLPKGAKKCETPKASKKTVECVRMRCFANGQWGDRKVLSESQAICGVKPVVNACDY